MREREREREEGKCIPAGELFSRALLMEGISRWGVGDTEVDGVRGESVEDGAGILDEHEEVTGASAATNKRKAIKMIQKKPLVLLTPLNSYIYSRLAMGRLQSNIIKSQLFIVKPQWENFYYTSREPV